MSEDADGKLVFFFNFVPWVNTKEITPPSPTHQVNVCKKPENCQTVHLFEGLDNLLSNVLFLDAPYIKKMFISGTSIHCNSVSADFADYIQLIWKNNNNKKKNPEPFTNYRNPFVAPVLLQLPCRQWLNGPSSEKKIIRRNKIDLYTTSSGYPPPK